MADPLEMLVEARRRGLITEDQMREKALALRAGQSPYRAARDSGDRSLLGYLGDQVGATARHMTADARQYVDDITGYAMTQESGLMGAANAAEDWAFENAVNPAREFMGFDPLPTGPEGRAQRATDFRAARAPSTQALRDTAEAMNAPAMSRRDVEGWWDVPEFVASSAADFLPFVATGAASGGLAPLTLGVELAGGSNEAMRDIEGLSEGGRLGLASGAAAINTALMTIGLGYLTKSIAPEVVAKVGASGVAQAVNQSAGPSAARAFLDALRQGAQKAAGAGAKIGGVLGASEGVNMGAEAIGGREMTAGDVVDRFTEVLARGAAGGFGLSVAGQAGRGAARVAGRAAGDIGAAVGDALRPLTNPELAARRKVLGDVEAGGNTVQDVRDLAGRGGGEMRLADLNTATQTRGGSSRRLGAENAEKLAQAMEGREGGRLNRMFDTAAEALDAPSEIRAETVIEGVRGFGKDLIADRRSYANEHGYSHMDGLNVSNEKIPQAELYTDEALGTRYSDRARALLDQADRLGMTGAAKKLEILRHGRETEALPPIPDDGRLANTGREELKALMRSRRIPTDTLYHGDEIGGRVVTRRPTLPQLRDRLSRERILEDIDRKQRARATNIQKIHAEERAAQDSGIPPEGGGLRAAGEDATQRLLSEGPVSAERLRSIKTAANDAAQSARQSGEMGVADAFGNFADRLRSVLAEGVRDASGRRASMIGDQYHAALSRAIEALEAASGIDVRTGNSSGSGGFFKMTPEAVIEMRESLDAARKAITDNTSLSIKTRNSIKKQFDRAYEAVKVGALRSYLDFLRTNEVSQSARVFNDESLKMRSRLKTLFPDQAKLKDFLRTIDDEAAMQKTEREVLHGSQTAERVAKDADTQGGGRAFDVFSSVRAGLSNFLLNLALKPLQRFNDRVIEGMTTRVADEIARMMETRDFNSLAAELDAARRQARAPAVQNLTPGARAAVRAGVNRVRQEAERAPAEPKAPEPARAPDPDLAPEQSAVDPASAQRVAAASAAQGEYFRAQRAVAEQPFRPGEFGAPPAPAGRASRAWRFDVQAGEAVYRWDAASGEWAFVKLNAKATPAPEVAPAPADTRRTPAEEGGPAPPQEVEIAFRPGEGDKEYMARTGVPSIYEADASTKRTGTEAGAADADALDAAIVAKAQKSPVGSAGAKFFRNAKIANGESFRPEEKGAPPAPGTGDTPAWIVEDGPNGRAVFRWDAASGLWVPLK